MEHSAHFDSFAAFGENIDPKIGEPVNPKSPITEVFFVVVEFGSSIIDNEFGIDSEVNVETKTNACDFQVVDKANSWDIKVARDQVQKGPIGECLRPERVPSLEDIIVVLEECAEHEHDCVQLCNAQTQSN